MIINKKNCVSHQACRNPGLNQGPLDLQSNALPTELFRLTEVNALTSAAEANEMCGCM